MNPGECQAALLEVVQVMTQADVVISALCWAIGMAGGWLLWGTSK